MKRLGSYKNTKPNGRQKQSQHHHNYTERPENYGWVILAETLLVAAIAIISRVFEPVVWAFLSAIAGYAAALSKTNSREEGDQNDTRNDF